MPNIITVSQFLISIRSLIPSEEEPEKPTAGGVQCHVPLDVVPQFPTYPPYNDRIVETLPPSAKNARFPYFSLIRFISPAIASSASSHEILTHSSRPLNS